MMWRREANKNGFFVNLLNWDLKQYTRPTFIANILIQNFNEE